MEALLAVTMAASFLLLPLVCYASTAVFLFVYFRRAENRAKPRAERWKEIGPVIRDPLRVATILFLAGVVMIAMIGGDVGLSGYADTTRAGLEVLGEAFTNWNDPLSARAISVRGGVFIVLISCLGVTFALVSYFRRRWELLRDRSKRLTD